PEPFLRWAEGERWLASRRGLVWAARGSVVGFGVTAALSAVGVLALPLWALFLAVNIVINQAVGPRVRELVAAPAEHKAALLAYAGLLETVGTADVSAALPRRLQERITAGGHRAHELLGRLALLTRFWVPASSLGHWPFQALFLWDIHLLDRLESWQRVAGGQARDWLTALGEAEGLVALGAVAHDHPEWVFPEIDPAAEVIEARGIGHPLLPDEIRVVNDVTVGPAGTFLLVTGSNMSGKSTLLRSIGVNVVLAGAGGPVCAAALRLPPVSLWTSVRVQDSLERGVSFFMAELQRLKQVVDVAREHHSDDPRVLYLLDEILQGTNTAERQIAARRIIHFLVDRGALGAVSTHDLALAEGPDLSQVARRVHFRETLHEDGSGPPMSFDYHLRPGLATSTNALRLMDLVGLDVD
ncbi:MAG: MutS family DNA mismatch repair protein, partial [Thermomicrobiales bacterium]